MRHHFLGYVLAVVVAPGGASGKTHALHTVGCRTCFLFCFFMNAMKDFVIRGEKQTML